MPFEGFTFDDSVGRTEQARARVPEGYYLMEAEKVEPTSADYEKTPGIFVTWRIVQGPRHAPGVGVGGRLRDYNTVKKDAQFGLGMTLGAIGMGELAKGLAGRSIPNYQTFQALCGQLEARMKGKRAVALIADQPGQTRPFSGIESLYPQSQWDELSGAAVVSSNGPLPSNSTAVRPPAASAAEEDIFADLDARI